MNPERYALLQDLFMQVCNLPEAQRREILDEACRDDHALRDEVLALLDQDAPGAGRLETKGIGEAIWGGLAEVQSAEDRRPLPEKVGPYRILGEIGRGGMGRVLRAEQDSPKRTVALKMIFSQATSESQIRRFEHEAELLGRLRHPGIAQIYDAGTARTESGPQPYFAMEYVRGVPLLDYVRERGLSIEDRLRLLVRICDAVQHAHSKGVVHRDLKPANILVEPGGQPKVLDFGVARALDSDLRLTTAGTTFGKLIGTIPYMSPEQASGQVDQVDTRSDVYALGVILFELLGERLPHDLGKKLPHEAARIIREEEPMRLSSINRAYRGDVETITSKSLERDPNRRYQNASDLAADIERFLHLEPIVARPPSAMYQLSRFASRHRVLVAGIASAFLALLAGMGGTAWAWSRAVDAREDQAEQTRLAREATEEAREATREARLQADKYMAISRLSRDMLTTIDPNHALGADTTFVRTMLEWTEAEVVVGLVDQPEVEAVMRGTIGEIYRLIGDWDKALVHSRRAHELALVHLPPDSEETMFFANELGMTLANLGRYEEAIGVHEENLDRQELVLGEAHRSTVASMSNLGNLWARVGSLDEAEQILRRAVGIAETAFGPMHEDTLDVLGVLGSTLGRMGRQQEALEIALRVLEGCESAHGADHPFTAIAHVDLARVLRAMGELPRAEGHQEKATAIRLTCLGPRHPYTLEAQSGHADLLMQLGQAEQAEAILRQVLVIGAEVYTEDSPDPVRALADLGNALYAQGKEEEAKATMTEAAERGRACFGERHIEYAAILNSLANICNTTGEPERSVGLYREILAIHEELLGKDHPNNMIVRLNMAGALGTLKRYDESEPLYRQAVEEHRSNLLPGHYGTGIALTGHGRCLTFMDRHEEAEEVLLEALEVLTEALGPEHPRTLKVVRYLMDVCYLTERPDQEAEYAKLLGGAPGPRSNQQPEE